MNRLIPNTLFFFILTVFTNFAKAQDWANLKRYQEENKALGFTKDPNRVVFMGNSITEFWKTTSPSFFSENGYLDRGISGQTTPQMLIRFRQDVVSLHPKVVVLLCGINDIAGNTGPSSLEMIEDNISSMVEISRANGINVVLSSVLPAYDFPWKPGVEPAEKVFTLNSWIKTYAAQHNLIYLDYYTSMVDQRKGLKAEYTKDGVHPIKEGYAVMEPLAKTAIALALKQKK
jgi:lysophospholipase L1-like esterase